MKVKYKVVLYLLAAIIGIAGFLRSFPLDFVSGNEGFYWGDHAQSVSGYYAYRDSSWGLPILWTEELNYPVGVMLGYTDSIPLAALLFKPFRAVLPPDFHYFGLWYLIVYLLQPIAAVFLIRQLGVSRWWHGLLAAGFSLLVPAFIYRAGHTALTTQGLLIIALGLYFQGLRRYQDKKPPVYWYGIWMLLITVSILIHLYFAAMVIPMYWAAQLDMPKVRNSWRNLIFALILPLVISGFIYIGFWYAPNIPVEGTESGYGFFSMNLLSPFVGGQIIHWGSQFQPPPLQAWEGGNYFGLGVMGIILAAVWIQRARLKQLIFRHRFLIILFMGLFVYALSDEIYAGQQLILSYPAWLTKYVVLIGQYLRASGRFFWPVGYLILFTSLFGVLSSGKKWTVWFTLAMLIIQVVDVPELNYQKFMIENTKNELNLPRQTWEKLFSGKRELYILPAWNCGGSREIPPLQMLAAKNHVLINTAYAARQSPNCKRKTNDDRIDITEGTVHFYTSSITRKQVENWMGEDAKKWCRRNTLGIVCVPYPSEDDLEVLDNENFYPFSSSKILSFIAYQLPGETGEPTYASRTVRVQVDQPGYLIRGPYIQLPAGMYNFQLKYHSSQTAQAQIGRVEVYSEEYLNDSDRGILEQFQLFGSEGQKSMLAGNFILSENLQAESLELRVFWDGIGDLTVDQIVLYQLGEESTGDEQFNSIAP